MSTDTSKTKATRATPTVSTQRRACRERVNRVATLHNLSYSDMAELMGISDSTVYHWMVPLDNPHASFPRKSNVDNVHKALDDLEPPKAGAPISRPAPQQLQLLSDRPPVDEKALLLDAWRSHKVTDVAEEKDYLLGVYRNLLTQGA